MRRTSKDPNAFADQWLVDIPLTKAELKTYREKDIQLAFRETYVIVKKRGVETQLAYKPSPIPSK